jgi:hypothetical protein
MRVASSRSACALGVQMAIILLSACLLIFAGMQGNANQVGASMIVLGPWEGKLPARPSAVAVPCCVAPDSSCGIAATA